MEHSFDIDVATEIGVNAAIVLKHIVFWCNKNRMNHSHEKDGLFWTYNSAKAFCEMFPYIKERTMTNVLHQLEESGYIQSRSDLNANRYDRTKWYAATAKGFASYGISIGKNCESNGNICQPIPDITTDKVRENKKEKFSPGESTALFEQFWKVYPRKIQRSFALEKWLKQRITPALFPTVMDGLRRCIALDKRFREGYTPYPATWINKREWENEYELPQPDPEYAPAYNGFEAVQKILDEPCAPPPKGRVTADEYDSE